MSNKKISTVPLSVLDLATVTEGKTAADSFHNSLDLARHAEQMGFKRYWLAEHHNMESVASSATSVLIGYIAGGTSSIRVGSGGIMLPNHSPLVVAEQFGTLASLYPGRIDLGLGRAPGTDQITAMALRRDRHNSANDFPQDIQDLKTYFDANNRTGRVRAIPGEGLDVPIWILGSSTDSAYLAGMLGLPYAFASHFAPAQFYTAINLYRQNFRPSEHLKKPYIISCVNVVAADTDKEAARLATSLYQLFLGIVSGQRKLLQPPLENMYELWTPQEEAAVKQMTAFAFVGGQEKIAKEVAAFLEKSQVNELMVTSHIFEHAARIRSYELFNQTLKNMN